jgi:hypothetical protein
MGAVFAFVAGLVIVGGVVAFVRGKLQRHQFSPDEIERLRQTGPTGAQLPTGTTEMDQPMYRDPDFELTANTVRNRQGL